MLTIKNLHASINGKEILKGIDLIVKPGEVHAIIWDRNGSGKSTLSSVLAGNPAFEVTEGSVDFYGKVFVIARSRRPLSRRNFPEFPVSGRNSGGKYG